MKRNEVRITDIPDDTFEEIKKRAKVNDRTVSKEVLRTVKKIYKPKPKK